MFGIFGIIEALDLRKQTLVFRSNRNYHVGQQTSVRVQIPSTGKVVNLQVEVTGRRSETSKGVVYRTRVLSDTKGMEYHGTDPAIRDEARHEIGIRVMSKDLPGYKAMTVDLSETGAQLEVDSAVEQGRLLELNFDVDNFRLQQIRCPAQVMWCRPNAQATRYRTGVEFQPPDDATRVTLSEFSHHVATRAHSDLRELLEEANMLAPDPSPSAPQASLAAAAVPKERRQAPRALVLPLQARLEGYTRHVRNGSLFLMLATHEGPPQTLEFPDCQSFRDLLCAQRESAHSLRSWSESPELDELKARLGPGNWKHYQLLDEDESLILEIFSGQCRPRATVA